MFSYGLCFFVAHVFHDFVFLVYFVVMNKTKLKTYAPKPGVTSSKPSPTALPSMA